MCKLSDNVNIYLLTLAEANLSGNYFNISDQYIYIKEDSLHPFGLKKNIDEYEAYK